MALINKKLVTARETSSYKLDCSTIELVRLYSEFIGSPQEHVVNESLLYIFRKDKDFNQWLKSHNKADLFAAAEPRNASGNKGRATAAGSSASTLIGGTD